MKPFHTIAIPHRDILEGRLTMDTFAADLWEAFHNRGVAEYRDPTLFFQKTYPTEGLTNLTEIIRKRLTGKGGDPVIQIQTPFGGGKTHSLIALMHLAKEWGANRVVIVGTNLSPRETLWNIMEMQLTGKVETEAGLIAPGKEKIKSLLSHYQPAVILIDELLEYMVKAGGVKVGESTLSAQTLAFMQELTESVATLEKVCLVVTLPASIIEHYDENAEKFFVQLQKVCGRLEKIYTPVGEHEIAKVIRKRLFSSINEKEASYVVNEFVEYAQKENILPTGVEPIEYRDRFLDSYPFMPEVIDVLYRRWGSFPSFQRTRGVLRILSLVVHSLKESNIPYISLADFDLAEQEIRQELIKHIGNEYNGIIAQDIIGPDAGSKKIDSSLGESYRGLNLATRAATTVFMYSFSGGAEKGATLTEIKRCATSTSISAAIVSDAIEQLKSKLFFTQFQNDKYFFSNTPNLNRIILNKMENIVYEELLVTERKFIESQIGKSPFKVILWEENSANIPDTEDLKLIILREEKEDVISQIIKNKGSSPRVFCNTIFFLCPVVHEYQGVLNSLRRYVAYEKLLKDQTVTLTENQRKEINESLQQERDTTIDLLLRAYRCVLIPSKDRYEKDYLGIPTYGDKTKLDERVYEKLKNNKILENISPFVLTEKYIAKNSFVKTKNLLDAFYKTPGEIRLASKEVLKRAIIEGVVRGDFGLGEVLGEAVICRFYKKQGDVIFSDTEAIISKRICEEQLKEQTEEGKKQEIVKEPKGIAEGKEGGEKKDVKGISYPHPTRDTVRLSLFDIPEGKVSDIMRMIANLQTRFNRISLTIEASEGSISEYDYENSILETLKQLDIEYDENN